MNQGRRSLLGMALLGAMEPLFAAPPGSVTASRRLDAELAAIADDPAMQLASLSVLAIRAGQPVYEGAFGRRTVGPDRPAAPDTLYRIASVSKLHTTLGLMRLVEDGFDAIGHLGDAYGLRSVFAFERATGNGMVVLVGGSSADPETQKGSYSALARFEERILTALYRQAIVGQQN